MSEWLSAISGLIGVMIGGLISYWVSERAEQRKEIRDVRTSARLLEEDLANVLAQVKPIDDRLQLMKSTSAATTAEARLLVRADWLDFPQQLWLDLRATLASALDSADWEIVKDAYYATSAFKYVAVQEDDLLAVPVSRSQIFREYKTEVEKGFETLARLGGRPKTAAEAHYLELPSPTGR